MYLRPLRRDRNCLGPECHRIAPAPAWALALAWQARSRPAPLLADRPLITQHTVRSALSRPKLFRREVRALLDMGSGPRRKPSRTPVPFTEDAERAFPVAHPGRPALLVDRLQFFGPFRVVAGTCAMNCFRGHLFLEQWQHSTAGTGAIRALVDHGLVMVSRASINWASQQHMLELSPSRARPAGASIARRSMQRGTEGDDDGASHRSKVHRIPRTFRVHAAIGIGELAVDPGAQHPRTEPLALEGAPAAFVKEVLPGSRSMARSRPPARGRRRSPHAQSRVLHLEQARRRMAHLLHHLFQGEHALIHKLQHRHQRMLHQWSSARAPRIRTAPFPPACAARDPSPPRRSVPHPRPCGSHRDRHGS